MATQRQFNHAYLLDGREWRAELSKGVNAVTARYVVMLAQPLANDELPDNITGLPTLGSAHPTFDGLIVKSIRHSEGTGAAKTRLEITVEYGEPDEPEQPEGSTDNYIEKISWQSGSIQRDLTNDVETGVAVLNSAGQPFESVPQVDRPAPTFIKVFKTKTRKSYIQFVDKVNTATLSVGGQTFAKDMVRCNQADEEGIFNDADGYKYRYSIALQVMSNKVKLRDGQTATECGWQVPIVDCGTSQISQLDTQKIERVSVQTEDGRQVPVSSPVLLDGAGHFDPARRTPYVFLVVAYERTTFPSEFTSEA